MSRRATHYAYRRQGKLLMHSACGRVLSAGIAGGGEAADWVTDAKEVSCKRCLQTIKGRQ